MLHFAYGANMHGPMMWGRCPAARPGGRALLPNHRFIVMREGFATIVRSPGDIVHGVLWRLTLRDLAVINADENLDGGLYRAVNMPVWAGRRCLRALVYVGRSRASGRPRPGYMEIVTGAARDAELPPHYIRSLERWASAAGRKRGDVA